MKNSSLRRFLVASLMMDQKKALAREKTYLKNFVHVELHSLPFTWLCDHLLKMSADFASGVIITREINHANRGRGGGSSKVYVA